MFRGLKKEKPESPAASGSRFLQFYLIFSVQADKSAFSVPRSSNVLFCGFKKAGEFAFLSEKTFLSLKKPTMV